MVPGARGLLGRSAPPPAEEERKVERACATVLGHSMAAKNVKENLETLKPVTNTTVPWVCSHLIFLTL